MSDGMARDLDRSSFFRAIQTCRVRLVSDYLESGFDPDERDEFGRTPLIRAVYVDREDARSHVVRLLVRHGCDVNAVDVADGKTALIHACSLADRGDVIRRIVSSGVCDPNVVDRRGNSALWYAAAGGHHATIRLLLTDARTKSDIVVDIRNEDGLTPLAVAAARGHSDCVRLLLDEGAADPESIQNADLLDHLLLQGGGSSSDATLSLERISLHSRQSLDQREVSDGSSGRSTPILKIVSQGREDNEVSSAQRWTIDVKPS